VGGKRGKPNRKPGGQQKQKNLKIALSTGSHRPRKIPSVQGSHRDKTQVVEDKKGWSKIEQSTAKVNLGR